jgi:hypothetical protein
VESASHDIRKAVAAPATRPAELVDQRGLADAGFATDEDHSPMPVRGLPQVLLELVQERFALE